MTEPRLVIAANRLPYRTTERKGRLSFSPSAGGLATSMAAYLSGRTDGPTPWVGASDLTAKALARHTGPERTLTHGEHLLVPVPLPRKLYTAYYDGFCNSMLWPMFHYFPSYARFQQEHFDAYVEVNRQFCARLLEIARPGDRIWVHDYHLMLLPGMLRGTLPEAEIAFFLHIPFPSHEVFRLIPEAWRRSLLQGLLGADLVGFHTHAYAQHFKHSVQHVLGYDHQLRTVRTPEQVSVVDAFPISIDTGRFRALRDDPRVVEERRKVHGQTGDRRILFSADRLDYTKGLPSRLAAYEFFLQQHPEFLGQVVFIMVVVPSRDVVDTYAELRRDIEMQVSRINGHFGRIDWTPVVYQYRDVPLTKLVALYSAADVALITPMRDGMNLVAKEFVACCSEGRGVLVLSETAGAAEELGGALLVNPNDKAAIAEAVLRALTMPREEQTERYRAMMHRLEHYDVKAWATDLLGQLHESHAERDRMRAKLVSPAIADELVRAYRRARSRVLLLDHDGTLAPFTRDPAAAGPTAAVLELIEGLAADPANRVVVISGRGPAELEAWFGHLPIALSAEHGVFFRDKDGRWNDMDASPPWKDALLPLFHAMADRCPGALVQVKKASLTWHYRGADRDLGFLRSRELIDRLVGMAPEMGFRVMEGNMVVEARPVGKDKGEAVREILRTAGEVDLILALGDDRTDEDMFNVLPPQAWSIRVGMRPSLARYNLRHQSDVVPLLTRLLRSVHHPAQA